MSESTEWTGFSLNAAGHGRDNEDTDGRIAVLFPLLGGDSICIF